MKKSFVYFLILLVVIGGLVTYIMTRDKDEEASENGNVVEIVDGEEEEKEEGKVEEEEKEVVENTVGFEEYSANRQEAGEVEEGKMFTLEEITDTSEDGYHEFSFLLTGSILPHAVAYYNPGSGVIKVEISNIEKDLSGIPFQGERIINKNGITRLYHNVSGTQEKSFYDIGLSQSTVFKLDVSAGQSDNEWGVFLRVKYPGEKEISGNFGSTEFSSSDQEIVGVGVEKNASALSYQYSASGGVLKFVWGVSADGEHPIPSVKASYNESNELVVVFQSLKLDRVGGTSKTLSLPLGITLTTSRSGESTTYVFSGMNEEVEYKLSASLSPNQVVLEIK
ncbi:hypothetical protein GX656_01500 [Candidatus Dojkabacteria bacterium]|uniref:Uncharacterized protein n=1 Tax=Candidatus Dojkabacteria bacterium TaxID=2099670 RepID=A0A847CZC2_9BACT|nr:hypothetical protein [Candidatus Dojkabacteria bacterium]